MTKNRALRTIYALYTAEKKTLTADQLKVIVRTNWAERGVNEARKIPGVVIEGHNPYTLISWGEIIKKKPVYQFDPVRQVYIQL